MDRSFLKRWMGGSALCLALLLLLSQWSGHASFGWSALAGGGWNLLNIFLLGRLTPLLVHQGSKSILRILLFLFLKFPLLYSAGFAILWTAPLSKEGVFVGFSVPLVFVFLQAAFQVGRLFPEGTFKMRKIYG